MFCSPSCVFQLTTNTYIDPEHLTDLFLQKVKSFSFPASLRCNLRCKYCYIKDDEFKAQEVSFDKLKKALDATVEFFPVWQSSSSIIIDPWGAELLCSWGVVQEFLTYAFNLPTKSVVQTKFSTNLTILPGAFVDFVKTYIQDRILEIQVSLDGPQEVHDFSRRYASGKGSFQDVIRNLEHLRSIIPPESLKFKSTLQPVQLTLGHYHKAVEFFLVDLGLPSDSVTFPMDCTYPAESIQGLKHSFTVLKQKWEFIKSKNPQATISMFAALENLNAPNICSACSSSVAIDTDGTIFPCHHPLTEKYPHKRDHYALGNVFTKTLHPKVIYRTLFEKHHIHFFNLPVCIQCIVYQTNPHFCYGCLFDEITITGIPMTLPLSVCRIRQTVAEAYWEWKRDGLL